MTTGCVRDTKMKVLLMYEIKSRQNDYASESEDEKEKKKNYSNEQRTTRQQQVCTTRMGEFNKKLLNYYINCYVILILLALCFVCSSALHTTPEISALI